MTPRANIYFSGCGLMDLGLQEGGVDVGQSFEIDAACCRTARHNLRHDVVECDLQLKLVADEQGCDVMAFTYPCTRYAEIAALHGVRHGDVLYLHALRHLALKRPEVYVCENVPGMKMFPVVMEAMTKLPGYYVHAVCPVKTDLWLPQRRDRLIIFGSRKPFNWRLPKASRCVSLRDVIERDADDEMPAYAVKRLKGGYRDLPIISDPARGDIAPTCVAHYAKDLSTRLVRDRRAKHGVRPWTVREYARLQGVPNWFDFGDSGRKAYRMIGNGVPVPMARWIGREIRRYFN